MSALSITSPAPMFTQSATLTQPVQTTAMAGPSQSGGGGGGGGSSGGGGGGGGSIATGAAAGGAQPAAPPRNGLKGILPMPFKGDKGLYNVFKTEWRMYKAINQNHDDMLIPYNHVMTMLGMVKGPLVSAWVQDYLDTVEQEVVQHGENAEILWTNFKDALDNTFKDTNEEDNAITRLEHLEMKKGNLAQYTAKFNRLRKKAGWDADSNSTIRMYKRGLDLGLLTSMLKQVGANPNTLRGWQELAT
jgi:Retrotransposon gag protein